MSKINKKIFFLFIPLISFSFQASMRQTHDPFLKSLKKENQLQPNQTQQAIQSLNALPLYFIENKGQIDERVRYQVKLSGMNIYFTSEEIVYQVFHGEEGDVRVENIRVKFLGMNEKVEVEGLEESEGKVNYFIGNDPEKWVQGARTYEKLIYKDLYPDIDLIVYGEGGKIKNEYRVRSGAKVEDIRIKYEGAEGLKVSEEAELVVSFNGRELKEGVPISYQVIEGERVEVKSGYRIMEDNVIRFIVEKYKKERELIIDPALSYSTFLGGTFWDEGLGIAIDGSGNAYVTGRTMSTDFPTTPGEPGYSGGLDVFITKLDSTGSALYYSTYLGGSDNEEGKGIAIDLSGNAYLTGFTRSLNFPTISGAYDRSHNGGSDVFIAKLNAMGTALSYSTFLGGSNDDFAQSIDLDMVLDYPLPSYLIYVTGNTESTDFPTTDFAYDGSLDGPLDVFVTKLNSTGSVLFYSTYLGGSDSDGSGCIAVDGSGNAYVTGGTHSSDFPITSSAYDTSFNGGGNDAFITKFNSTGSAISYSTYIGGSGSDSGIGVAIDGSGNAYVTGITDSPDFPTTFGAYDKSFNGGRDDAFIAKFNSTGSAISYSTYLGGSDADYSRGIAINGSGDTYVTGYTMSNDFPTTSNAYDISHNNGRDVFITKLNSWGSDLSYSTYLGGANNDYGFGIAIDGNENAYVTGYTGSYDFPTTYGAYATSPIGGSDVFVTKLGHVFTNKDDLIGTWPSGVWYRNSDTGAWINMSSAANLVAAGDLDGDGIDDLIDVWSNGLWVKYSSSGSWAKLSTTLPTDVASGDMNGDGRDDILGTWSSGVWYRNSITGNWVKMSTPANLVAAGDLEEDAIDDLIGIWSSGLWAKYSSTNNWLLITPVLPTGIASGDMNGDGRDDILGTWSSGVWYRDSMTGTWVKMSTPANLVAAGDIVGDPTDDLIGTWSSGLWVKNSSTSGWEFICTSLPSDIDAGFFRTGWGAGTMSCEAPVMGVYAEGPANIDNYEDLTSEAPGEWNFVYREEKNLTPEEKESVEMMRIPGPGEPGFKYMEQKNLEPVMMSQSKKERRK